MKIARYLTEDSTPRSGRVDGGILHELASDGSPTGRMDELADVTLLPAIEASAKFICVGLNYRDHAAEAGAAIPERPLLFAKLSSTLIASGDDILIPDGATQVDWEAELGVVIGRTCSQVSVADALDHVWGYVPVNDVSARDFQFADGQWMRGKSVDTFGPVGPYLVTADEVPDPQALTVTATVNGRVMQNSSTSEMIFSVADIISYVSQTITLERGDLIATGTPAGVGAGMNPPVYLVDGDTVVVSIERLDPLVNPVGRRPRATP